MVLPINRLISIAIFIIGLTGFGSAFRVVTDPQRYSYLTKELNISCIVDGPSYSEKSIVSIQVVNHMVDKPIAIIDMRQRLKMAVGVKNNIKAEGHIDKESSKGYLTLIIDRPGKEDAGTYRCQAFLIDENFQMVEKNVIGNVTYEDPGITGIVKHLAGKLSSLLKTVQKQNKTMQTLGKQHATFKNVHSKQKQDIDNLTNKIHRQNDTNNKQEKQLNEFKDYHLAEKQDIDILKDEMDIQHDTDIKLKKQMDEIKTDNTKKQQQLDELMDVIKQQNKTIKTLQIQVHSINKRACHDKGWTYYKEDQTCLKVFGKDDDNKRLSWSKAREACQTFRGDLVQIHDEDKNTFVLNMYGGSRKRVWIGISNNARVGFDFNYVDGSDLDTYHPWYSGYPNGEGDHDRKCVCMYTGTDQPGVWLDKTCALTQSYVCSISFRGVV